MRTGASTRATAAPSTSRRTVIVSRTSSARISRSNWRRAPGASGPTRRACASPHSTTSSPASSSRPFTTATRTGVQRPGRARPPRPASARSCASAAAAGVAVRSAVASAARKIVEILTRLALLQNRLDRRHREGGDDDLVVLHLVGHGVDPVAVLMLERDQLSPELVAPVVLPALGVGDERLADRLQRLREHHVVVVDRFLSETRVLIDRVVVADPL